MGAVTVAVTAAVALLLLLTVVELARTPESVDSQSVEVVGGTERAQNSELRTENCLNST